MYVASYLCRIISMLHPIYVACYVCRIISMSHHLYVASHLCRTHPIHCVLPTNRTLAVHERVDSRIQYWQVVNRQLLRVLSTDSCVYYRLALKYNKQRVYTIVPMALTIVLVWRLRNINLYFTTCVFGHSAIFPFLGGYMYACMYVCMYVCMYACMCVCMYVCLYVCIYVCLYVCMCVCMHVCISVCLYVSTFVYQYVCLYVCLYVCMYVHSVCMHVCTLCLSVYMHVCM